jgi:hypothetical protein
MQINVSANINEISRYLTDVQKRQIPYATVGALNDVAFKAGPGKMPGSKVLAKKADEVFDRGATAFTKRAFKVVRATRKTLTAIVFVDKQQSEYLKFQIRGGTRFPKHQALMISTDKTPGINKFGNIKQSTYKQLINNKTKYFKGVPKGYSGQQYEGIWERYGRSKRYPGGRRIRMVARYIDKAQYRPLFPFAETVEGVVFGKTGGITDRFRKRLEYAIRTAKPRR